MNRMKIVEIAPNDLFLPTLYELYALAENIGYEKEFVAGMLELSTKILATRVSRETFLGLQRAEVALFEETEKDFAKRKAEARERKQSAPESQQAAPAWVNELLKQFNGGRDAPQQES